MTDRCAACLAPELEPYLRVRRHSPAADLVPTTDDFGAAFSDIVRCRSCGHGQLEHMPTEAELGEAYGEAASEDYVEEEAGQRVTAREALALLERHAPGRRLLDLGCWVGFLLDEARERGWEGVGVEPSEFASRRARETLGLEVITADLLEADLPEDGFDAIVMGDVIEHLPQLDTALRRIGALLAPGGVLLLTLPDAGSRLARAMGPRWWSVIPTHVHHFTRNSLQVLLARHGFSTLALRTAPKAFTVRYYLDRIGGYSPQLAGALVAAAGAVGVAERLWAPDFRDRMQLLARVS